MTIFEANFQKQLSRQLDQFIRKRFSQKPSSAKKSKK